MDGNLSAHILAAKHVHPSTATPDIASENDEPMLSMKNFQFVIAATRPIAHHGQPVA
jgi:hypothetical protein